MCQLLETIKLEHGRFWNLDYHSRRLNAARAELFDLFEPIDLTNSLEIPANCHTGLYRCRVMYSREIESVEYIPQHPRGFHALKVVEQNNLDYHLKFADRSELNKLLAQRGDADEVIIVQHGLVTDSTIANLVFFDGRHWLTPDTPLLKGTQRQRLLDLGLIFETRITANNLHQYEKVGLINAFFDLNNMPIIKKENIF